MAEGHFAPYIYKDKRIGVLVFKFFQRDFFCHGFVTFPYS